MRRLSLSRLATLAVVALLGTGCGVRPGSGHGRVLEALSKRPVPGAQVTVICEVASSWHGTTGIEHTAVTAPDGTYFIDPIDFRSCADIHGFARKPGYVPNDSFVTGVSSGDKGIPAIIYVMTEPGAAQWQLDAIWRDTPVIPLQPGSTALGQFARLYRAFSESRRTANSPELAAWVRGRYCPLLRDTFALLSPAQRAALAHEEGFHAGADDYATEVLPYCTRPL
jgi:hypothetical protein